MGLYPFLVLSSTIGFFLALYLFAKRSFFLILGFFGVTALSSSLFFLLDMPSFALILLLIHGVLSALLLILNLAMQNYGVGKKDKRSIFYEFLSYVAVFTIGCVLFRVLLSQQTLSFDKPFFGSTRIISTKVVGEVLFSHYLPPFFILVLIFFAGIMGVAMVHGKKKRRAEKGILKKQLKRSPDSIELKSLRD